MASTEDNILCTVGEIVESEAAGWRSSLGTSSRRRRPSPGGLHVTEKPRPSRCPLRLGLGMEQGARRGGRTGGSQVGDGGKVRGQRWVAMPDEVGGGADHWQRGDDCS
jgi:hypothetical protein